MTALLQPYGLPPPLGWRGFVTQAGGEAPESNVLKFELGECEIAGPNGQPMWVDSLEHALQHCDVTAAAGISGLGYDFLSGMSPTTVRPLLRVWFGQGRWDYANCTPF